MVKTNRMRSCYRRSDQSPRKHVQEHLRPDVARCAAGIRVPGQRGVFLAIVQCRNCHRAILRETPDACLIAGIVHHESTRTPTRVLRVTYWDGDDLGRGARKSSRRNREKAMWGLLEIGG